MYTLYVVYTLFTLYTLYTLYMLHTLYTLYGRFTLYTLYTMYTLYMVYTLFTLYVYEKLCEEVDRAFANVIVALLINAPLYYIHIYTHIHYIHIHYLDSKAIERHSLLKGQNIIQYPPFSPFRLNPGSLAWFPGLSGLSRVSQAFPGSRSASRGGEPVAPEDFSSI